MLDDGGAAHAFETHASTQMQMHTFVWCTQGVMSAEMRHIFVRFSFRKKKNTLHATAAAFRCRTLAACQAIAAEQTSLQRRRFLYTRAHIRKKKTKKVQMDAHDGASALGFGGLRMRGDA